jgi:hypothetical protein
MQKTKQKTNLNRFSLPLLTAALLMVGYASPAQSHGQTHLQAKSTAKSAAKSVAKFQLKTLTIDYKDGNQVLQGYLAYNAAQTGKRPAVMLVHDWIGVNPNVKKRAEQLAEMGYIAFAADIYGKGVHPKPPKKRGKWPANTKPIVHSFARASKRATKSCSTSPCRTPPKPLPLAIVLAAQAYWSWPAPAPISKGLSVFMGVSTARPPLMAKISKARS